MQDEGGIFSSGKVIQSLLSHMYICECICGTSAWSPFVHLCGCNLVMERFYSHICKSVYVWTQAYLNLSDPVLLSKHVNSDCNSFNKPGLVQSVQILCVCLLVRGWRLGKGAERRLIHSYRRLSWSIAKDRGNTLCFSCCCTSVRREDGTTVIKKRHFYIIYFVHPQLSDKGIK